MKRVIFLIAVSLFFFGNFQTASAEQYLWKFKVPVDVRNISDHKGLAKKVTTGSAAGKQKSGGLTMGSGKDVFVQED